MPPDKNLSFPSLNREQIGRLRENNGNLYFSSGDVLKISSELEILEIKKSPFPARDVIPVNGGLIFLGEKSFVFKNTSIKKGMVNPAIQLLLLR